MKDGDLLWSAAQSRPADLGDQSVFAREPVVESDPTAPNAEQKSSAKR